MSNGLDKSLLKKFAVDARIELKDKIILKASLYGITLDAAEKNKKTNGLEGFEKNEDIVISINNEKRTLSKQEQAQRTALMNKITRINREGRDGFNEVIEEVAYTWFNRFVALRYMEVNGYISNRINVLASKDNTSTPEILTEAMNVKFRDDIVIDKERIYELKRDNKNEELYMYLVELKCIELNKSLPFMFEKLGHYAELLFPPGLMTSKFFRTLVDKESITEEAWENVEIIGWLYQYYISDEKDRVIKAKKKYKKNEIPFATQLFTPDWIVRYMVQNSLGRYWVESHEEDNDLKENWEFYLENPEKEPDFDEEIAPYINKNLEVEDIKCFDPACGSGHILVYMFDVLHEIYTRCGYSKGEIPLLIIEKNLYGLDIDTRAYQLACFAVIMKGMSYDKLLLRKIEREVDNRKKYIDLNIACVKETNILFEDDNTTLHDNIAFLAKEESGETYDKVKLFVESLKNANTFGSLTKIEGLDKEFLEMRLKEINTESHLDNFDNEIDKKVEVLDLWGNTRTNNWNDILEDLIKQATIMENTYDILVTNPPYMGSAYMNPILGTFINKFYSEMKSDLFSAFIEYCFGKVNVNGHLGMITPFVWMFISSYEQLRKIVVDKKSITSLIELEYNAFPEACVPVCTFTLRNISTQIKGEYIKLSQFKGSDIQSKMVLEGIKNEVDYRYSCITSNFKNIESYPIAFWASNEVFEAFREGDKLEARCSNITKGIFTGDNERFIRVWIEVDFNKILANKWRKYSKGGAVRKWYGNSIYVVKWGKELENFKGSGLGASKYFGKPHFVWSKITNANISFRYDPDDVYFDDASPAIIFNDKKKNEILGYLNSKVNMKMIKYIAPTLNYQIGDIKKLPILDIEEEYLENINKLVEENINIAKYDWDLYELSWDYKITPFVKFATNSKQLESIYAHVENDYIKRVEKLKENEKYINEIFIKTYGLENYISPEVDEKEITLSKININSNIRDLLSYYIGCIFGRYSLDKEGLIFAGGQFDINKYRKFIPDSNNIIPVLSSDSKYFEDDVMVRFEEFLKVTFSEEYLSENIDFIAEALGKKANEDSRDTIRRYFANDFFTEHCKMYKKRPIYWLFTSGKNKAFSCLVYQHRIDKNLLSKMRMDYVQPLQNKLDVEQKDLLDIIASDASAFDKKEAKKKLTLVEKQIDELKKFHDKLKHMADKQIEIDLDNGVVYNHSLFGDLVANIK